MEESSSAEITATGALAWHEQVCRGFGEGKPSSADHPFHHLNERKRRKNPVNYADEPDLDGLRHAPKKKRFLGAKHADNASKWAQGPLPAPFLVICMRHPQPSFIVLIASQSKQYANFDCVLPQALSAPHAKPASNRGLCKRRLRSICCCKACLPCWLTTGRRKQHRMPWTALKRLRLMLRPSRHWKAPPQGALTRQSSAGWPRSAA